jgi:hypothetical protein
MAQGEKVVIFDFQYKYSDSGQFKEEFAVTVRAPSLADFSIHNVMTAYAAEAQQNNQAAGMKMFSSISSEQLDAMFKERRANRDGEQTDLVELDTDMVTRVISTYAAGLGAEKFDRFMAFLKKTLTGNPRLVTVGETKIPLKDAEWEAIAQAGGMDAITQIMATFAGFFLEALPSKSPSANGDASQASLPSGAVAH